MKLTYLQLNQFFSSFAMLLRGGISLCDGAAVLAPEAQGKLREVLFFLGKELDGGVDLARAMENSGAFPAYAVTMVALGQRTGQLEDVFSELAAFYEERQRLNETLRSAFFYPGVLLVMMLAVIGVLLIWVLPVFDGVYASLGSPLTGLAGGLLAVGMWLKGSLPYLFGLLVVTASVIFLCLRSAALREALSHAWKARFGDRGILRKVNNARFLRGIAMGMRAGLLPEEAVRLSAELLAQIPDALGRGERCLGRLQEGKSLCEGLLENGFLSGTASGLLNAGLRSGSALMAMEKIAEQASREVRMEIDRMLQRIEPAMVLTGSVLVGTILLSVMWPLIHILSLIG